jgi:dihydrolipoamide dehydrogenase
VRGKDYVVGLNPYQKSAMGMARLSDHGFCKLIFDRKKRLIGAHIIGDEAATMIHQLIYAMTKKAKLDDLLEMIYIHPALPEIVRNAARNAREAFMSMKQ